MAAVGLLDLLLPPGCAACGRYGEVVCAWIRAREQGSCTAEEIVAFCRENIAHFKVPQHIRFVDEFPMTVTGKIQKFVMRERMMQELALHEERTA